MAIHGSMAPILTRVGAIRHRCSYTITRYKSQAFLVDMPVFKPDADAFVEAGNKAPD
jgi:hypothetical protein